MSAALALTVGASYASIRAVPGEALLVPFAAADYGEATNGGVNDDDVIHTAVILQTPGYVGTDTVLNGYTLPNTLDGGSLYIAPEEMTVHWYAFDERSKEIENGTFDMTPNDVYLWSPKNANLREYIGYLVFADDKASDGTTPATFAMAGNGFMLLQEGCEALGEPDEGLCSDRSDQNLTLPVVPMADGIDWCQPRPLPGGVPVPGPIACAEDTGNAHLAITYLNNVVAAKGPTSPRNGVGHVSPLVAAIRTQAPFSGNAQGLGGTYSYFMVNGLFSHYDGNWTHIFWFSENVDDRIADPWAYDDDETESSCTTIDMPNELNGVVYADDENRVYDLIKGFRLATDNDGDTTFSDACLQNGGGVASAGENCRAICGTGGDDFFGWPERGFTQAEPGIGIMEYTLDAGPTDTSTAVIFQFMSNIDWDGNYAQRDIAVGRDFDVYAGGYQEMIELGKF